MVVSHASVLLRNVFLSFWYNVGLTFLCWKPVENSYEMQQSTASHHDMYHLIG